MYEKIVTLLLRRAGRVVFTREFQLVEGDFTPTVFSLKKSGADGSPLQFN